MPLAMLRRSLSFLVYEDIEKEEEFPCDVFRIHNRAIAMSYFSVGFVSSFIATPLNVYLVEVLNAEPPAQNTIAILQSLPWTFKLIFGFLSDAVPIHGMHRKPYLTIGALLYSTAFILFSLIGKDSIIYLSLSIFFGTLGLIQMDVMADTMCVERSKFEEEETKGQMQATCYSIRFGGSLVGAIMGATLCNKDSWGWGLNYFEVSTLNGFIPFLLVTPWLYCLKERYHLREVIIPDDDTELAVELTESAHLNAKSVAQYNRNDTPNATADHIDHSSIHFLNEPAADAIDDTAPIKSQLHEIWQTVQLKSVWQPMTFVFLFNLFQVPNVAWQSYLQLSLEFEPWLLGLSVILGSFMTFAGILAYKYLFFKASWRSIYLWSACLTTFFSLLQLMLIFQINQKYLHLNNYLFSLGDDVITAYISGIQFLPVAIMYMRLCPAGAEGSSYAMLTTLGNIALVCASNLGVMFAQIWDVSNAAMRRHDISGLWKLSCLTSIIELLPLLLISLLPSNPEEQEKLAKSPVRSPLAGAIFLIVLFGCLLWSIISAISTILSS